MSCYASIVHFQTVQIHCQCRSQFSPVSSLEMGWELPVVEVEDLGGEGERGDSSLGKK